jgi:chromosome segregation ATPase
LPPDAISPAAPEVSVYALNSALDTFMARIRAEVARVEQQAAQQAAQEAARQRKAKASKARQASLRIALQRAQERLEVLNEQLRVAKAEKLKIETDIEEADVAYVASIIADLFD